jgi:ribosomal protein S12
LSAEKLEIILRNSAVGAGEWFLFQMLKFWYEHRQLLDDDRGKALGDARQFCERYIRLTDIEPAKLLSAQVQQCDFVTPGGIFTAVAQQALRASRNKAWRMLGRGCRRENAERVLVEGAGSPDANGMYYRVAQGHGSDLYSKRETVCGQEYVYTLSRCLIRNDINNETVAPYYECRIFCSKFLTHNSVRSLQIMQSTNTINPFFQPVMQVLEVTPPFNDITMTTASSSCCFINNNLSSVPSPIRKYYRVRLSDGEHFMPGTLSRELSVLVEGGDLQENHVIQILEFGLYTMDGSGIGIHIIKAAVVTTATEHCFGDPVPLTESSSDVDASLQQGDQATLKGLQNMYQCRYPAADGNRRRGENAIPQTGWQVDSHGVPPAPICTWIPAIEKDDSTDNASITSAMTMPVSS